MANFWHTWPGTLLRLVSKLATFRAKFRAKFILGEKENSNCLSTDCRNAEFLNYGTEFEKVYSVIFSVYLCFNYPIVGPAYNIAIFLEFV